MNCSKTSLVRVSASFASHVWEFLGMNSFDQKSDDYLRVHPVPLFTQFPVLLLIGRVESKQRLQMASVCFHILVVDVDVVQLLLLLEYLFRGTLRK